MVGRSFLLCRSFHLLEGTAIEQSIFAPYFLVPFGLAVAILVLELGLVARHRVTMWAGLCLPALLVLLSGTNHRSDAVYREFLDLFMARLLGTPLFLTLLATIGFYAYAWLRRVPLASEALTAAVAALAFTAPGTLSLANMSLNAPVLLAAAVAVQAVLGLLKRDAWRLIAVAGVGAAWLTGLAWRAYVALRSEILGLDYLILSLLLLPIAVLVSLGKAGVLERWVAAIRRRTRGLTRS